MKTIVKCMLNGMNLTVTNNSIEISDSTIQIELIKRLIDCRAFTPIGESPLPLFINKYLSNYNISNVQFIESPVLKKIEMDNYDDIDEMIDNLAA